MIDTGAAAATETESPTNPLMHGAIEVSASLCAGCLKSAKVVHG